MARPGGAQVPEDVTGATGWASFAGRVATEAVECVDVRAEPGRLATGTWFVVADFEGRARAWRFARVSDAGATAPPSGDWQGPAPEAWTTSMDQATYEAAVRRVRAHVRDGDVYQANICRVLSAPLPAEPDARALAARLAAGNPAPHAAAVHVPAASGLDPVWVVSASPELYLSVRSGPDGTVVESGPIKGTARTPDGLTEKDRAENVMITDLVRNDLQTVCRPGTVAVSSLLAVEEHPGLVHLVSRVRGVLRDDVAGSEELWCLLLAGTFPPGSVSGAPKTSALRIIGELEPVPRGPYCGAVGWVDDGVASLAVGIRTFWWADGVLRFGTGAGITWGSDPTAEWHETELKAERLVGLASGPVSDPPATVEV
ncbi:chorismate-binding protein [Promicromonospora thailandica]|uniref:Para-aminobenzoate synthetase component 1 n=1 Tax=Promicromonospora thailandica TaxID=765201 RepID=A0A9X2G595_9MICO|nr:chorismate-binding protein [Promicromonospora thailandica]MCP2265783.1 para-aminobenzoate synthetase component 1 [Promicromonospora thailandica]